jgi:methylthioribose-1-phosphate isomerase
MTPLEWNNGKVRFLDQTKLPTVEDIVETDDETVIAQAIKRLAIRGAPLIGIAAAYAVALSALKGGKDQPAEFLARLQKTIGLLSATRPTAANLFRALNRQTLIVEKSQALGFKSTKEALLKEAVRIHQEDAQMCQRIGELGEQILPNAAVVLTHCNTGMLATGGIGTALGIIRIAWEQHKLKHVYIDETRPLFQGARLTAWELAKLRIPSTLIPDSAAAFLMQRGLVNAVLVGADRIAANGDVANKVGTYNLAVVAKYHGVPMYVAAPTSTIDFETSDGKAIPIEHRNADETRLVFGSSIAPDDVEIYSPAFDITPNELITGIVTERSVLRAPYPESMMQLKHLIERERAG